jgi:toxin FitB
VSALYLLDTNVVSELRKHKPHGAVLQWIQDIPDSRLHISAVTVGEIQAGIELTREQDKLKAEELEQWLGLISGSFNVIAMDALVFRAWARLMHRTCDTLYEDAMIAATAKVHKLIVVTRNVKDFKGFGVSVFNPFIPARK